MEVTSDREAGTTICIYLPALSDQTVSGSRPVP